MFPHLNSIVVAFLKSSHMVAHFLCIDTRQLWQSELRLIDFQPASRGCSFRVDKLLKQLFTLIDTCDDIHLEVPAMT